MTLDSEIAAVVAGFPSIDIGDLAAARAAFTGGDDDTPLWADRVDAENRTVPGPPGAPPVPVRIYRPRGAPGPLPAVVYLHGGSFVVGGLDTHHVGCGDWAAEIPAVVVNVDYRLAPEAPFPAAVEDCYAVLDWVADHADDWTVDPARIAVAGSSAGGGLAACLALMARDRGGPAMALQMLNYPVLDDRRDTASMRTFRATPILTSRDSDLSWGYYLGEAPASAYAAAARATDLTGLPPAYVLTCDQDPLRDEGIAYARRLIAAGVPVDLHHYAGTVHGFDVLPTRLSQEARDSQTAALRRALT